MSAEPRTESGRRLLEAAFTEEGLPVDFGAQIAAIEAEAVRSFAERVRREVEADIKRRDENATYMLSDCDGTTPLGNEHEAKGFRRTDCLVCNGEDIRSRHVTWPAFLRHLLLAENDR